MFLCECIAKFSVLHLRALNAITRCVRHGWHPMGSHRQLIAVRAFSGAVSRRGEGLSFYAILNI